MPLVLEEAHLPPDRVEALLEELCRDLEESRSLIEPAAHAPEVTARLRTARDLLDDALGLAASLEGASLPEPSRRALANVLYDATLVVAEYYKTFVRRQTVPQRPTASG